jgi:hypothetical protein
MQQTKSGWLFRGCIRMYRTKCRNGICRVTFFSNVSLWEAKNMLTKRSNWIFSSAQKPDDLGKIKESVPHSLNMLISINSDQKYWQLHYKLVNIWVASCVGKETHWPSEVWPSAVDVQRPCKKMMCSSSWTIARYPNKYLRYVQSELKTSFYHAK